MQLYCNLHLYAYLHCACNIEHQEINLHCQRSILSDAVLTSFTYFLYIFTMFQKLPADVPSERKKTWTPSCTLTTIARLEDWWGALFNRSTQPVQPPLSPAHVPTAYPPVQGDLTKKTGECFCFCSKHGKTADSDPMTYPQKTVVQTKQLWFHTYEMIASITGWGLYRGVLEASWSMTILLPNFKPLLSTKSPQAFFFPVPC